jgi:hypothetical protein
VAKETVTASWSPAHLNFPGHFAISSSLHLQGLSYHFAGWLTLIHD